MRYRVWLISAAACGLAGCFAPFTRPDDRAAAHAAAGGDDALTRAAEALDRGDDAAATAAMREYVAANPGAVMPRAHLADLLDRQGQATEARRHYERFAADAQGSTGAPRRHLVRCHTRLADLARLAGDDYAEALHRGVGLWLLAQQDAPDELTEPTLTRSLDALREARDERPDAARPHLYLAKVLAALGQPAAAAEAMRRARDCLPDATLTPAERGWVGAQ